MNKLLHGDKGKDLALWLSIFEPEWGKEFFFWGRDLGPFLLGGGGTPGEFLDLFQGSGRIFGVVRGHF